MWNVNGYLWSSTQNILPIHWKIQFINNVENLKSSQIYEFLCIFEMPPRRHVIHRHIIIITSHYLDQWWSSSMTHIYRNYSSISRTASISRRVTFELWAGPQRPNKGIWKTSSISRTHNFGLWWLPGEQAWPTTIRWVLSRMKCHKHH